ncbi:hypothetical protein BC781_111117 [Sediminitomix flava]|uniref:Uncharacterized protein n=1 Tax=Sediminitomix flava TaxID=379075 RepID=A0A315YXK3_SEDFL|nr:hypothetical protein BC781_111117 [Sediminitomix flava]
MIELQSQYFNKVEGIKGKVVLLCFTLRKYSVLKIPTFAKAF